MHADRACWRRMWVCGACSVLRGLGVVEGGYSAGSYRLGRTRALLATGGEEQGEV